MLSLLTSSRKFLPLRSDAWKIIFQVLRILLLSNFLLKSQEYLFGNRGMRLNNLVSELTALWRCQLPLLGHSQNLMVSRSSKVDFVHFYFLSFIFIFLFFIFSISIFRTTQENEVEGTRTKWRHTIWTPHVGLMYYSWSFRVGCTVVSTDHGD